MPNMSDPLMYCGKCETFTRDNKCLCSDKFSAVLDSGGGGDSKKNSNPKDRLSADRLDLSLFPVIASAYGALAMTEGGLKYGPYNWREPGKGVRASVYYAACRRHLDKWLAREWEDPKTGVPHLASALADIAILIDAYEVGCVTDDRPKFLAGDKDVFATVMNMLTQKAQALHAQFSTLPPPAVTRPDAEPQDLDDDHVVCKTCGADKLAHPNGDCLHVNGSWIPTTWKEYKKALWVPLALCENCGNSHKCHDLGTNYCPGSGSRGMITQWEPKKDV